MELLRDNNCLSSESKTELCRILTPSLLQAMCTVLSGHNSGSHQDNGWEIATPKIISRQPIDIYIPNSIFTGSH